MSAIRVVEWMMERCLAYCGATFSVQEKAKTKWPLLLALVAAVIAIFVSLTNAYIVPFVFWALIMTRLDHVARPPAFVVVSMRSVRSRDDALDFTDIVRICVMKRGAIELHSAARTMRLELQWLGRARLVALARHLDARVLLARGPQRSKAERAALEAFHVFGARAVRVKKRAVVELLGDEGPWSVARKERVYVRRLPASIASYRTNARTHAVELGQLA